LSQRRVKTRVSRRQYLGIALGTFAGLVVVWGVATGAGLIPALFLPSPGAVAAALVDKARSGELWGDIGLSCYRITMGYLLATAMALVAGPAMGASARIEAALEPLFDFIRYMPVVAFVPLTILWVGTGDSQKFLIIWLGTFFQQVLMVADAVRQVPQPLVHLGETLGMGRGAIMARIIIPAAWPRIFDPCVSPWVGRGPGWWWRNSWRPPGAWATASRWRSGISRLTRSSAT
jgi:NitT/TauT family transport system permease protein